MAVPRYLEFAPRIIWKRNVLPHYLVFFITRNCTAKCKHCLLGERAPEKNDLRIDEIEKFSRTMDPLLFLLITGGDPFLRKDIVDIVRVFYRTPGFRNLGMPSNGLFTDKIVHDVEEILVSCPGIDFAIDISLDAVGPAHDDIRGVPGLFDKATETFRRLTKLKSRFPNFNLNVAVTVSHFNDDQLDELYSYLKNELRVKNINHLLCRGDPRDPEALDVNMSNYRRFSEQLDKDVRSNILSGYAGYPFADMVNAMKIVRERLIQRIVTENRFIAPCFAGRLGVIIYPDGDVAACEIRNDVLGNLREQNYDFRAIIQSGKADAIRKQIADEKCFCTYECFLTNAVMFNPAMLVFVAYEVIRIKIARFFRRFKHAS